MVVRKYMSRQRCMNCTCHSPASKTRNNTGLLCTLILGWRNTSWTGNCSKQFIPTIHVAIQLSVTTYNNVSQTNNRWFVLRTKIICLGDCARHLSFGSEGMLCRTRSHGVVYLYKVCVYVQKCKCMLDFCKQRTFLFPS